jgi:integrase
MSVRKRQWKTPTGEPKEAWVVRYNDGSGKWRLKTFERKKDADAFHDTVKVAVRSGTHTPDSESITVAEAGGRWIKNGEANNLERATLRDYQCHLDKHIVPIIGPVKLSKLTAPMVNEFRDRLRDGNPPRSPAMVKKILTSLSSILADAHGAGLVAQNVARSVGRKKKRTKAEQRRKLRVGVDIPTVAEIRAIVGKLEGQWRPLILTAIFSGLRASELRGLRWTDVDFTKGEISVRQRADRYNKIDAPKSEAGERTVRCRRWCSMPCGNGSSLVPRGRSGSRSPRATVASKIWAICSIAACGLHKSRRVSSTRTARRDIRGSIPCATSSRRGASTARPTAAWNSQARWCRSGSGIRPSR